MARNQAPDSEPLRDIWPIFELATAFHELWHNRPELWRKKQCSTGQWQKVERLVKLLDIPHADIQKISGHDAEMAAKIEDLSDWGQYTNAGIVFSELSLVTAELLMRRFLNDWGCGNKNAKKKKKNALKDLKKLLADLRKQ